MILHWWLLPLIAVMSIGIWMFYLAVRLTGGTGVRSEGRTVVDKPVAEVAEEDDSKSE
jgi:hypothetical protein